MKWGIELWDGFEEVSSYMHKGIEFFEKYESFWKKRCDIENSYAKSLRKLVDSYEPKKKDSEENKSTHVQCFTQMLSELKDIAGQHELIAENVQERVTQKLIHIIKSLKEDRRKCIEDKEKFFNEKQVSEDLLEKSKSKYEKAFKEVEKAKDQLTRVENDDSASKNDIRKQKNVVELKQRMCTQCQAEYGNQLCQANNVKNIYFKEKLPSVLETLEQLETKRIHTYQKFAAETVNIEIEVMPRIQECLKQMETSCNKVSVSKDTDLVINLFKTGYVIPDDYVFEDLAEKYANNMNNSKASLNNSGNSGFINSTNGVVNSIITLATPKLNGNTLKNTFSHQNSHDHSENTNGNNTSSGGSNHNARQKKYRTINRIKGLLFTTNSTSSLSSNGNGNKDSSKCQIQDHIMYNLPPEQLKKELIKKIDFCQAKMCKTQKETEGLTKMRDIYATNENFGDIQSVLTEIKRNEEKIASLKAQLEKYQSKLTELESNGYYSSSPLSNQTNNSHQQQQHYGGSMGGGSGGNSSTTEYGSQCNGTSKQLQKSPHSQNIYQSSSEHSVNSNGTSLPGTPMSYHSTSTTTKGSTLGAYAISSVAQMNGYGTGMNKSNGNSNGKTAPIASSDRNESFDEDDDEDDDDEEDDLDDDDDEDDGNYEKPNHATIKQNEQSSKSQVISQLTQSSTHTLGSSTSSSSNYKISSSSAAALTIHHENGNSHSHNSSSNSNTKNSSPKYDQVDSTSIIYERQEQVDHYEADESNTATNMENEQVIGTALVMYTFAGTVQNAMSVQENESLDVLEKDSGDGWTLVKRLNGEKGYVPTDYIRIVYY